MSDAPLLSVRGLKTFFHRAGRVARAVDGVSFDLHPGETLALVGESGSGKTVTALSVLRLIESPPGRIEGGEALFRGRDLLRLPERELRRVRGAEIGMVFQDPASALNPVYSLGSQIAESARLHLRLGRRAAWRRAVAALERVGIPSPELRARSYPHQLSGGMKQRAVIAMALAAEPRALIADEPTTALDVTVQAQIVALFRELQRSTGLAILLITHDMGLVSELADRVVVLYAGRVVEAAAARALFEGPRHPYTAGLFASLPCWQPPGGVLRSIPGEVPDPFNFPAGCRFHPRCPAAAAVCTAEEPVLSEAAPGHLSACVRLEAGRLPAGGDFLGGGGAA